jgi:dUTP pyrophosphatase
LAGVIDAGYRGDYGVVLLNTGHEPFVITKGMKIAQMIIERCHHIEFEQVSMLDETVR